MLKGRLKTARVIAAALLLSLSALSISAPAARGDSAGELQDRMDALQAELDDATARLEDLRHEQSDLMSRRTAIQGQIADIQARRDNLLKKVVKRADELYRSGGTDVIELLFSSKDFTELTARTEMISKVSLNSTTVFVDMARTTAELDKLSGELGETEASLDAIADDLATEADALQGRFNQAAGAYRDLQTATGSPPSGSGSNVVFSVSGNITCPVAGPVSFSDTWGAPRVGHTHQGVDMMAAHGTPLVAIVSGTITYSGYGSSAGNWQILSGNDGNTYWYMHNATNIVTSGPVEVGRQIATVGDTGNASYTAPHLHFEFHPGGGSAVNPTPLVSSVC